MTGSNKSVPVCRTVLHWYDADKYKPEPRVPVLVSIKQPRGWPGSICIAWYWTDRDCDGNVHEKWVETGLHGNSLMGVYLWAALPSTG